MHELSKPIPSCFSAPHLHSIVKTPSLSDIDRPILHVRKNASTPLFLALPHFKDFSVYGAVRGRLLANISRAIDALDDHIAELGGD